jgi:hypothetical protein
LLVVIPQAMEALKKKSAATRALVLTALLLEEVAERA